MRKAECFTPNSSQVALTLDNLKTHGTAGPYRRSFESYTEESLLVSSIFYAVLGGGRKGTRGVLAPRGRGQVRAGRGSRV